MEFSISTDWLHDDGSDRKSNVASFLLLAKQSPRCFAQKTAVILPCSLSLYIYIYVLNFVAIYYPSMSPETSYMSLHISYIGHPSRGPVVKKIFKRGDQNGLKLVEVQQKTGVTYIAYTPIWHVQLCGLSLLCVYGVPKRTSVVLTMIPDKLPASARSKTTYISSPKGVFFWLKTWDG